MKITNFLFRLLVVLVLPAWVSAQEQVVTLENQRELFVDDYLVEEFNNMEARLGTPVSGGVALKFDKPWEGTGATYVSVVHDGVRFRMYYRGVGREVTRVVTCYAESVDGIHWTKPSLGLFEVNGTRKNNVVMLDSPEQSTHNLSVFYDGRPGVTPEERFKAVGGVASSTRRKLRGLYRYVSADGIHWKRLPADTTALFRSGYGLDSQNILTWVPGENCYAIYLRTWTEDKPGDTVMLKGIRTIARSVSRDFIHWSEPVMMQFGDTPPEHLYTNATQPYFRAPQILISMPFRFSPEKKVLSDEELKLIGAAPTMWKGVSDAVLMSSRGGNSYSRKFMESFVRPGPDAHNWAARSTIPGSGVIPTGKTEMSFFVTRAYTTGNAHLERMKLRIDGFASLHAGYGEGNVITKPVILNGSKFKLNYSTSSVGYVKIVLLDEDGKELPGFTASDSGEITGDEIDGEITWKSGRTVRELEGKTVRIKFIAKDADIYSFGIF